MEESHLRKLFEVYYEDDLEAPRTVPPLESYNAVVAIDYGHGMFDDALISKLARDAQFLAVNVQTNSGNYGFNLAKRWPRADYLCVDEPEARLATQNRDGPIERSVLDLLAHGFARVIVTQGKQGAIGCSRDSGIVKDDAMTDRVVDTMGAGDAFFAVTALFADQLPVADLLKLGNAAGALKAQIVGHRSAITKQQLISYLKGK